MNAPSKRRKKKKNKPTEFDPSKMKMSDLIYFNPQSNPMIPKDSNKEDTSPKKSFTNVEQGRNSDDESEEENRPVHNAPQVKIGPDGTIILDTESLVKEVTPKRKLDDSELLEIHEDASNTTYSSYSKRKYIKYWSKKETTKFYKALSAAGTDFSMINAVLPHRSRSEIKRKYKREERLRKDLIDQALKQQVTFDMTLFETSEGSSSEGEAQKKEKKQKERKPKVPKKRVCGDIRGGFKVKHAEKAKEQLTAKNRKQKPKPIPKPIATNDEQEKGTVSSDNEATSPDDPRKAEAMRALFNPLEGTDDWIPYDGDESNPEEEDVDFSNIHAGPTRSGRQPKKKVFTTAEIAPRIRSKTQVPFDGTGSHSVNKIDERSSTVQNGNLGGITGSGFPQMQNIRAEEELSQNRQGIEALQGIYNQLNSYQVPQTSPSPQFSPRTLGSTGIGQLSSGQRLPNSAVHNAHSPNSFRHETFLVSMPGGSQSLIRMPVPNNDSFQYVLNVVPSPDREQGNMLQLIAVPSPQRSQSQRLPYNPSIPQRSPLQLRSPLVDTSTLSPHFISVKSLIQRVKNQGNNLRGVSSSVPGPSSSTKNPSGNLQSPFVNTLGTVSTVMGPPSIPVSSIVPTSNIRGVSPHATRQDYNLAPTVRTQSNTIRTCMPARCTSIGTQVSVRNTVTRTFDNNTAATSIVAATTCANLNHNVDTNINVTRTPNNVSPGNFVAGDQGTSSSAIAESPAPAALSRKQPLGSLSIVGGESANTPLLGDNSSNIMQASPQYFTSNITQGIPKTNSRSYLRGTGTSGSTLPTCSPMSVVNSERRDTTQATESSGPCGIGDGQTVDQIDFVSHNTGCDESDLIVAQQVDVSSSQEDGDDSDGQVFIPP